MGSEPEKKGVRALLFLVAGKMQDKRALTPFLPHFYTTSNSPAAPMPPPTHIVHTTNFALRRFPSINA